MKFINNGSYFTIDNVPYYALQQLSSKDCENSDEKIGKFRTGFIDTYLLSRRIKIMVRLIKWFL